MKELLSEIAAQIDKALEADFTVPSDTGQFEFNAELADEVVELIDESIAVLETVEARFDHEGPDDGSDPATDEVSVLRAIGAEISSALAQQEIADLAFVSRHQLAEIRRQIESARAAEDTWHILAHRETAIRRVRKGLVAVESALREYAGAIPLPRQWESIEDALEIRRVYGQFRRSIARRGRPGDDQIATELTRVARRIAILRDREIYPYLRIEDRREIRTCQKRIEAWLDGDLVDPEHRAEGQRLWQDLVAFANLLAQVSRRQTLAEHDREVLARTIPIVGRRDRDALPLPRDVLESLQTMQGRDDELDDLLHDPDAISRSGAWRRPILRLLDELDQPYRPSA